MALIILSAGRDPVLVETRRMVLESAGFQVIAVGDKSLTDVVLSRDFDAVVLCHTIPLQERQMIATMVKNRNRSTPVLLVSDMEGQQFPFGTVVPNSPAALLAAVRRETGSQV